MIKSRVIFMLLALLLALLLVKPAAAHANLVRSEPSAGASLPTAPAELVLEFSEDLDTSFSKVQLFNSKSELVNAGPGVIDPAAPLVLRLTLAGLANESYTAIYKVRSAVDGHITEGNIPFGVGVAAPTTSLIPPPGTPEPASAPAPPLDAAARWLNFLLAALALGGLPFGLLVWRPALGAMQHARADPAAADETMTCAIRQLILVGCALFVLANGLFLLAQASAAAGVPLLQAIGGPAVQLLRGRSGLLLLARVALTLLIVVLAWRLPALGRGRAWRWWAALTVGCGVLLTFSLNSHGAAEAQGAAVAVLLDWLHLVAMVGWLGGFMPLIVAIGIARRESERVLPLRLLIPRFSWLAAICLALLTLTGIYSYVLHIGDLDLVAATTYGRTFAVKIGLFGLLLLLGGLNLFILSPRLRAKGNHLAQAFGRSTRLELVAGTLLLLAVGAMTSVAPSKTAWEEQLRLGLMEQATVGEVDLVLRVAPAQIGDNEFVVDVTDKRPGAQDAPSKVLLNFGMLGMDMGELQTETRQTLPQRYSARGSFASMGGRWQIEVVLRRAGFDDVRHTFEVDIVRAATLAS